MKITTINYDLKTGDYIYFSNRASIVYDSYSECVKIGTLLESGTVIEETISYEELKEYNALRME